MVNCVFYLFCSLSHIYLKFVNSSTFQLFQLFFTSLWPCRLAPSLNLPTGQIFNARPPSKGEYSSQNLPFTDSPIQLFLYLHQSNRHCCRDKARFKHNSLTLLSTGPLNKTRSKAFKCFTRNKVYIPNKRIRFINN